MFVLQRYNREYAIQDSTLNFFMFYHILNSNQHL